MPRTPEQREADEALQAALDRVIRVYGLLPEGSVFADFICVVEGLQYPEGSDQFDDYHAVIFRDGQMRRSVARGLLDEGYDIMRAPQITILEHEDGSDGSDE